MKNNSTYDLLGHCGRRWPSVISALALIAQITVCRAACLPTYEQLKSFGKPATGGNPQAELIQGADGALYGTASQGGSYGAGTVFKLNPDGTGFTVLQNLDYSTTGGNPYAGLIQGADGALYGTTANGGAGGYGTAFKLNPDGTGFTVLQSFDLATTGGYPLGTLTPGPNGTIYGTTGGGGSAGAGTVFRLVPDNVPPTVSCSVAVSRLSPVNNQLVNVGLSATSSESDLQIQVFSDEPKVPVLQDATLTGGVLQLRARRNPGSDGRVYLIVVTSTDACGNVGVCCSTLVVPKNGGAAALASVQAQAAAAQAKCTATGSPTTPYRILP